MDTGGLAQMTYNNFGSAGFVPSNGFASRGKASNVKRLSVALPPKVNSINEEQVDSPLPRTTSRSHLLAGLRTAPKSPASAPYSQSQHQFSNNSGHQSANAGYGSYGQATAQSARSSNQFVMNAGAQTYALPDQVLAPPSLYDDEEIDPSVLEQLQLTGMYLAQRQQQLQQQLANITAASNQFQGMNPNLILQQQQQQQQQQMMLAQQLALANQQQMQTPIEVPGQPGLYLVFNPAIGQYQYLQQSQPAQQTPRRQSPLARSGTMPNLSTSSAFDSPRPVFRAEVSPPPMDKPNPFTGRSITPPKKTPSPASAAEHVEPLPPPSATAFRRGHHKKVSSLSLKLNQESGPSDGPKTSSAAVFGSARPVIPAGPMTGTFGPGAARAGEHPMRQPRGPPPLEELMALPTANHEGSKNFVSRRRRRALDGLMRASSSRRASASPSGSPISEGEISLNSSQEDEPGYYRKQSPIGSERSTKRGSQSSIDGSAPGSTVQTPATEDINVFDMRSFAKQLPNEFQPQERKKMMLGVLSATEKRKSFQF